MKASKSPHPQLGLDLSNNPVFQKFLQHEQQEQLEEEQLFYMRLSATMQTMVGYSNRTIYIAEEITGDLAGRFILSLDMLNQTDGTIEVVLTSPGGDVEAGLAIYDAIRESKNPVVIIGYGCIHSMAAIILQAAKMRILMPEARFMIHSVSLGAHPAPVDTVAALSGEGQFLNNKCAEILAQRSGQKLEEIKAALRKESYMSAEQCVKLGFADIVNNPDKPKPQKSVKKPTKKKPTPKKSKK